MQHSSKVNAGNKLPVTLDHTYQGPRRRQRRRLRRHEWLERDWDNEAVAKITLLSILPLLPFFLLVLLAAFS